MKEKKAAVRLFTIADWEKEQDYLRRQHQRGWKLDRVTFFNCYHFVRCQPEDVVYQLDYNPEGLANKEEYVQLFADCGWEYLQDYAGYSYFRKAVAQMGGRDEKIFCDDQSRLALVRRVFWGRMVPALVILLLLVCPYVIQGLISPHGDTAVLLALFLCLLALYTVILVKFARQYWRLRQRR